MRIQYCLSEVKQKLAPVFHFIFDKSNAMMLERSHSDPGLFISRLVGASIWSFVKDEIQMDFADCKRYLG